MPFHLATLQILVLSRKKSYKISYKEESGLLELKSKILLFIFFQYYFLSFLILQNYFLHVIYKYE